MPEATISFLERIPFEKDREHGHEKLIHTSSGKRPSDDVFFVHLTGTTSQPQFRCSQG